MTLNDTISQVYNPNILAFFTIISALFIDFKNNILNNKKRLSKYKSIL